MLKGEKNYISIEDFYEKASLCKRLTREAELVCAQKMKAGDITLIRL